MLKSNIKISSQKLNEIADYCHTIIINSTSKDESLKKISQVAFNNFGEFFGPYILEDMSHISINFIEILDQILFTINNGDFEGDNIKNYIIDDLYARIQIYLEIFKGTDYYKKSLSNRILSYDDTLIISQYQMSEYIPDLMSEFYDQPNLRKPILNALLRFDVEELINFYYQIIKDIYCLELKCLALLGLKTLSIKFNNWYIFKNHDEELSQIISYGESFDTENIENSPIPNDIYRSLFAVKFIEININTFDNEKAFQWIFKLNHCLIELNNENPLFTSIMQSMSNIINVIDLNHLKTVLRDKDNLALFIRLLDLLPGTFFNRIIGRLNMLGMEFFESIQYLINAKKMKFKGINSNILNFIYWVSANNFRAG